MDQNELKRAAARAALGELVDGAIVGVGSGSTVDMFIDELGARRARIAGAVSSSERSSERLRANGIEVLDLNQVLAEGRSIPVYVDGADEIDGAPDDQGRRWRAHAREDRRAASGRFVCIVELEARRAARALPLPSRSCRWPASGRLAAARAGRPARAAKAS